MKGSLRECFEHFITNAANIKVAAEFVGVTTKTVITWSEGHMPGGINLIKLQTLLQLAGHEIEELKHVDSRIIDLNHAMSFDLITVDQAAELVDINPHGIYRIATGRNDTMAAKKVTIGNHIETIQGPLTVAINLLKNKLTASQPVASDEVAIQQPTEAIDKRIVLHSLSHLIHAILPLARLVNSNDFSAEDREKLRTMTGGDGVFQAKNVLTALCSERARKDQLSS